jgi:cytochrome b6-f complex iron-sulfur subunit
MATAGLAWPTGQFILFGEPKRGKLSIPLAQLREGITPLLAEKLYLRKSSEHITVFDAHCTHMGCTLRFDEEHSVFNCPCHKSRFDIDGVRLRGPAKRDLDTIAYTLTATALVIG